MRYTDVIAKLKQRIESGEFKPGDTLPRQDHLAEQVGVALMTLRRAVGELQNEGWLRRVHGTGTFVLPPEERDAERAGHVLVVDDDRDVRRVISRILTELGYVPEEADGGAAAVASVRHRRYSCVFTDLRMPEFDGVRAIQEMRQLDPMVPIVVVTGFPEDLAPLFEQGGLPVTVIPKPFRRKDIEAALAMTLRR